MDEIAKKKHAVKKSLQNSHSDVEAEFATTKLKEFSILLFGPARVGKSSLINAICGRDIAPVSAKLDSCTKTLQKYPVSVSFKDNLADQQAIVSFWDSPGIENWTEGEVKNYVLTLLAETYPICAIFCAAPGCLAPTNVIRWTVEACVGSNIFVCLVGTNKWSGGSEKRNEIRNTLTKIINHSCGEGAEDTNFPGIHLVPKRGLFAFVNSDEYVDDDLGVRKEPEGVAELCCAIMHNLDEKALEGWCVTLLNNRDFWTKMKHQVSALLNEKIPNLIAEFKRQQLPRFTALFEDLFKSYAHFSF